MSTNYRTSLGTWATGLALIGAATAGGFALDHVLTLTSVAMMYVLAVVIAAYTLGPLPSALCALGSVLSLNFFFVPPRLTFDVEGQENTVALFTMLVVALVISHLTAKLRGQTELARLNAMRAQQLQELAMALASANHTADVASLGLAALNAAFEGPCTLSIANPQGELQFSENLPSTVRDGLNTCMAESATLGPGTGRWPGLNAWYIPLGVAGHWQGAARIDSVKAADELGREHAQALCALLGQTLSRLEMANAMRQSQSEAQRQQMQSTFLAAISHDLRTPLATIVGAATGLRNQPERWSEPDRERLLDSIVSEASYLSNVTDNTLQLVQLTNAAEPLRRGWESIEEIVGAVLNRMRPRDPTHRITAQVPQDLPLIEADPVLIAQLLANLLDNALKYSGGPITMSAHLSPLGLQLCVTDHGAPIAAEHTAHIFKPYTRGDHAGQRGSGLGLALCQAIAWAHGGTLTLQPGTEAGNDFVLSLPVNPAQPCVDHP